MYCPRCGNLIDSFAVSFCPKCGYYVGSMNAPAGASKSNGNTNGDAKGTKGDRKRQALAVVIVLAVVGAAFIVAVYSTGDGDDAEVTYTQPIDDRTWFEISGDFLPEKNTLSVSFTPEGQMKFALGDDLASQYTYYSWTFTDLNHASSSSPAYYSAYKGDTINKAEPALYYLVPEIGEFKVSVTCYTGSSDSYVGKASYSGNVRYFGPITKDYEFTYGGKEYSVSLTFGLDDYREYKAMKTNKRSVFNYYESTSFVTYKDPAIKDLAAKLEQAYGNTEGKANDFAGFILAFVQICFDYPPYTSGTVFYSEMNADRYLYGQDEYFAYPLETVFHGMGDCEDTSILAAALFKACGYDSALVLLPGHAVAGVALDSYDVGNYQQYNYEILSKNIGGRTYYGCETTVDSFQKIGLVSLIGYDGRPYSSYVSSYNMNGYGFYTV